MSTVWRATDLSLSREVAVKILRDEVAAQADAVARFRREAHAAAKLNHPNIVQIYDTGVDGSTYYIVMEYLPEPDLKHVIKGWAPLPEEKVVEVATQCLRALAYAHRNGIIHRDVKPHNILFTDEGRAKLSDFGIAAAVGTGGIGCG
jgi:serine/threonine-protein kinase